MLVWRDKIGVWDWSQHLCFSRGKGGRAMTTYEVAEGQVAEMPWVLSLPLSDLESEVVSAPA